MNVKIKMDDTLKELGLSKKKNLRFGTEVKEMADNGTYSKNIANRGLFIHYDILIFEKNVAYEDTYLNVDVNIELYQATYEFDVVSGLSIFENTEKYALEFFSFTIESDEPAYTDDDDWNKYGESSLRELALAKIIEIEELIYNKIKEA